MKTLSKTLTSALFLSAALCLNAATTFTTKPNIIGNYHDTGTIVWNQSGAPGSGDTVHIRDGATININNGELNEANQLILANRGAGTLNITNGSFRTISPGMAQTIGGGQAAVGVGEAVLNIHTNGTATFTNALVFGNYTGSKGTVNVGSGGTLNLNIARVGAAAGAEGRLNIAGGTVNITNTSGEPNLLSSIGSANGATGYLDITSGSLTVERNFFIGNRISGTSNGVFTMSGGTLTVKNYATANADYLLIGASNAADQDTNGIATITGGTINANIIVGGNTGAGSGKLILGANITAINPMASGNAAPADPFPTALSVRQTGILQFDLGADLSFNTIDLSAGKVQFVDGAQLILNVSSLGMELSGTIDLLKVDGSTEKFELGSSVTYSVIGNDSGNYDIDFGWRTDGDYRVLQAVVTAIPEPSTYALVGAILAIALVMFHRRKH